MRLGLIHFEIHRKIRARLDPAKGGVRPSPAAASHGFFERAGQSLRRRVFHVAAPEDGRTPAPTFSWPRVAAVAHGLRLLGLALCLFLAAETHAAPLRVTTWSMQPKAAAQTNGAARQMEATHIQDAAAILKKLNPDVIILQQVENWQSCDELIKTLRPTNYNLVVCSSFRDARTSALSKQQVAILSKAKSYISWSEAWKSEGQTAAAPGGFAFAAVKLGNKNVGIFSVQIGDANDNPQSAVQGQSREEATRQLLRQIAALQNWTANRIEALVVGGDFNTTLGDQQSADEKTLQLLDDAGLANAFLNVPLEQRVTFPGNGARPDATVDYVFVRNAGLVSSPQILPIAWSEHYPVTCELDLNAPKPVLAAKPKPLPAPAPVALTRVESPSVKAPEPAVVGHTSPAPVQPEVVKPKEEMSPRKLSGLVSYRDWFLMAGGFLLLVFFWRLIRRSRAHHATATPLAMKVEAGASISLPTDAERIVITHQSTETPGSATNTPTIVHIEASGASQTQSQAWQRRAEVAERRAQQATVVLRAGLMPHLSRWLKEKLVRKLVSDRAHLMEAQQAAALKMLAVDERLSKLESQIQQRNQDYEQRIDELIKDLAVAKEENRELIQAKITLVKAEMERERRKQSEHRTSNFER